MNILIIDDSDVIRNLLGDYLSDLGYGIEYASDGQEGIEKALAGDFQLVFCDIHMPKKNGFDVFKEVSSAKPGLPFVMTDSLPDKLAEMAEQAGAHCCLKKPFDLSEVRETVEKILPPIKTT